ncbi:hypothetical protein SmJEL517_g05405 [Synchytrium microbalum]|uniref:AN1-type domain-containing protein n=1 Tax=Synchytrium microbalum TaxID=1806994 RepID=A0A507BLF4_9FUNG|nr:uncharacterized protein SmJEL517_g05405 [Synchytrium microbalum]TPX31190.1 hypothetical protein SmJEL517_g05405 [Synchytrium microbalum]
MDASNTTTTTVSSTSAAATPSKKAANLCPINGCTEKRSIVVGLCRYCNDKFCSKHRHVEAHRCPNMETCRQESAVINMGFGFILARVGKLSSSGSKTIAQVLVTVLYPCVFMSKIISAIDSSTLQALGFMFIWELVLFALGLGLGLLVRAFCNPPQKFRNGSVMATMMGNWGDISLAVVGSLGNYPPFGNDAVYGQALVSAYQVIVNLIFFSFCYMYIGRDFTDNEPAEEPPVLVKVEPNNHSTDIDDSTQTPEAILSTVASTTSLLAMGEGHVTQASSPHPSLRNRRPSTASVRSFHEARAASISFAPMPPSLPRPSSTHRNDDEENNEEQHNLLDASHITSDPEEVGDLGISSRQNSNTGAIISRAASVKKKISVETQPTLIPTKQPFWLFRPIYAVQGKIEEEWQKFVIYAENKPMLKHIAHPPSFVTYFFAGLTNMANVSIIMALVISQIPAIKNLLVPSDIYATPAPDQEPPLRVIQDTFTYIGAAAVPMGLLNMGAAIGRLKVQSLPPARLLLSIAASRLVILPIIAISLCQLVTYHFGWVDPSNKIYRFILMFQCCVPTAGSAVFLTQIWSPDGSADEIAAVILVQYALAFISLTVCNIVILTLLA